MAKFLFLQNYKKRLSLSVVFSASLHIALLAIILYFTRQTVVEEPKLVPLQSVLLFKKGSGDDINIKKDGKAIKNEKIIKSNTLIENKSSSTTASSTPLNKDISTKNDFNLKNLSLSDNVTKSRLLPNPLADSALNTPASKPHSNIYTVDEIKDLYGAEYGDLGTVQKNYIKENLKNIGRITQKYLKYPEVAAYFGQKGENVVEFYLLPNGNIEGLKIIRNSKFNVLDQNSLKTVEIAYKDYPHPKEKVLIRIRVTYISRD